MRQTQEDNEATISRLDGQLEQALDELSGIRKALRGSDTRQYFEDKRIAAKELVLSGYPQHLPPEQRVEATEMALLTNTRLMLERQDLERVVVSGPLVVVRFRDPEIRARTLQWCQETQLELDTRPPKKLTTRAQQAPQDKEFQRPMKAIMAMIHSHAKSQEGQADEQLQQITRWMRPVYDELRIQYGKPGERQIIAQLVYDRRNFACSIFVPAWLTQLASLQWPQFWHKDTEERQTQRPGDVARDLYTKKKEWSSEFVSLSTLPEQEPKLWDALQRQWQERDAGRPGSSRAQAPPQAQASASTGHGGGQAPGLAQEHAMDPMGGHQHSLPPPSRPVPPQPPFQQSEQGMRTGKGGNRGRGKGKGSQDWHRQDRTHSTQRWGNDHWDSQRWQNQEPWWQQTSWHSSGWSENQ